MPERLSPSRFLAVTFDVNPTAAQTLRLCHQFGMETALVTSKNAAELQFFVHRFSGAQYQLATVCAANVHFPKPDPGSAFLAWAKSAFLQTPCPERR